MDGFLDGWFTLTALHAGGDPLRISRYQMLKTARSYLYSSGQNTGVWWTDRQTDGQKCVLWL